MIHEHRQDRPLLKKPQPTQNPSILKNSKPRVTTTTELASRLDICTALPVTITINTKHLKLNWHRQEKEKSPSTNQWKNQVLRIKQLWDDKKHSNHSPKSHLYSEYGLLSGSTTLLSIIWERQTHIPIMTLAGRGEKRLGKREGGEQTNCHSSGAKYPSKESDAKGIKEKKWPPKPTLE